MKQIFKTQCYALRHSYDLYLLAVITIGLVIYEVESFYMYEMTDASTAIDVFGVGGGYGLLLMIAIVAMAVGKDFVDKTINYDVLAGYNRKEVLAGRFLAGLVYGGVAAIIMNVVPGIIAIFRLGWDDSIPIYCMVYRVAGSIIVIVRIVAEVSLLAVIVRNAYATIGLSLLVMLIESAVGKAFEYRLPVLSWLIPGESVYMWYSFDGYAQFGENGGTNLVVAAFPDVTYAAVSIISSIVISILSLWLANRFFEKRDMA